MMKWVGYILLGVGIYYVIRGSSGTAYAATIPQEGSLNNATPSQRQFTRYDIQKAINKEAKRYNLDPYFLAAIVKVESNWDPYAVDPAHTSFGAMQLTMPTARWMGYTGDEQGLYNPYANVHYGAKYLAWLRDRPNVAGNLRKMAMGYNGGPDLGPVSATSRYAGKVMYWYNTYQRSGVV